MKGFVLPICIAVILVGLFNAAAMAQFDGAVGGGQRFAPIRSQMRTSFLDLIYGGFTGADEGVGYQGSYGTLGAKTRMGEDMFGGNWFAEGRGSVSIETGQFFGSAGFERQIHIAPANADVGVNVFYDVDDDKAANFGHTFQQVGVGGFVKTDYFDIIGNGYIPTKETEFLIGSPTNCFFGNNILLQHGFDAALKGFDLNLRVPLPNLAMISADVIVGGYFYRSQSGDVIDPFGGFHAAVAFQTLNGILLNVQLNHDDFNQTTVLAQAEFRIGGRGTYSRSGRDLEKTLRNDHIVRVHQDPIFATNPTTGALWRVIHVDNTAGGGGTGTVERPFTTLAAAAAASAPDDIIFVNEGDGTTTGMNLGIALQDRQQFLGDGSVHFIPTVEAGAFQLCNDTDGINPTITNLGGTAITLADDNVVRGFNIVGASTAIASPGAGSANILTTIDEVTITGGGFGIDLFDAVGAYMITDTTIGGTGMLSTSLAAFRVGSTPGAVTAPVVTYVSGDIINEAGLAVEIDGIAAPGSVTFTNSITDGVAGTGIRLNDLLGTDGADIVRFDGPLLLNASTSGAIEVSASTAATTTDGNIVFSNATITDRDGIALRIRDTGTATNAADVMFTGSMTAALGVDPAGAVSVDVGNAPGVTPAGTLTFTIGSSIVYDSLGVGGTGIDIDSSDDAFSATFRDVTITADGAASTGVRISDFGVAPGDMIDFTGITSISGATTQTIGQGVDINSSTGASAGTIRFADLRILSVNGNALDINNGLNTIDITLGGAGIINDANRTLAIQNMDGGSVTIGGGSITNNLGGTGILIRDNVGTVGAGMAITVTSPTLVSTNTAADPFAVTISGNTSGGVPVVVTLADLNVTTTMQGGLTATVNDTVFIGSGTAGSISAIGGAAVDVRTTDARMTFSSLSSTMSGAEGVRLESFTGAGTSTFTVTGSTTITDPVTNGISVLSMAVPVDINFGTVDIDLAATGILLSGNVGSSTGAGSYAFAGGTIDDSTGNGIRILNSDATLTGFTVNSIDSSAIPGVSIAASDGGDHRVSITSSSINNDPLGAGGADLGTASAVTLAASAGSTLQVTISGPTTLTVDTGVGDALTGSSIGGSTLNSSLSGITAIDGTGLPTDFTYTDDATGVTSFAAASVVAVEAANTIGSLNTGGVISVGQPSFGVTPALPNP